MNTILSLFLAGATAVMPHADEQQTHRITLGGRAFYPGGKVAPSVSQRLTLGSVPVTWYVFTGKTLCEAQTVSSEKPAYAGNGWRVDLKPATAGTVAVTWEKLWAGGKATTGGGTRSLTLGSGSPLVLDSIDGGARLRQQEELEKLRKVPTTDLETLKAVKEIANGGTGSLAAQLDYFERRRRDLIEVQRLGLANAQVVGIDAEIAQTKRSLKNALVESLADRIAALQQPPPKDAELVDGCDALSMSLQVTAETSIVSDPTETEIWLVHKDPAGLETMQRQVVRSASGNGSYVFDDIVVKTERGPITIEVYGSIGVRMNGPAGEGGLPYLGLEVNRRYVATAAGATFGWKTKEGGTAFGQSIRLDEVVAFNLLPLKDDDGVFVGHRFSVRVRTKILK